MLNINKKIIFRGQNFMNRKFSTLLFLIILATIITTPVRADTESIIITEKMKINEEGQIQLNERSIKLSPNLNVVYLDQKGQELIDLKDIPPNAFTRYFLNSNHVVENIEVSGRIVTSNNNEKIDYVYVFNETVEEFKISPDEKYLAYTDYSRNNLTIIDLITKEVIWKISGEHIYYDWHPQENLLAYSITQDEKISIKLYNPETLQSKKIISMKEKNVNNYNRYINFLQWHPQGELIAYTVLEGFSNAHGCVSALNLVNLSGTINTLPQLNNINYFTWSSTGSFLAYSRFTETNPATSTLGIWDFTKNKNITIQETNSNAHSPIFSSHDKYLIYCNLNGLMDNIIFYNLHSHKIDTIKEELRWIDNFQWLDEDTLVYTFGDLPQIKKFDIISGNTQVISEGFAPLTINKGLYFLKKYPGKQKTYLCHHK